MNNEINWKTIIVVILLLLSFGTILYVVKNKNNSEYDIMNNYKIETIENYEVNQYIPVMINDEQMSKKYLLDYINSVSSDIDESYNLLNEEYRTKKFGSLQDYKDYVNTLNLTKNTSVDRYATYESKNFKYYDIYDINGNRYIFRTNGVMQYELFFDEDTVRI